MGLAYVLVFRSICNFSLPFVLPYDMYPPGHLTVNSTLFNYYDFTK